MEYKNKVEKIEEGKYTGYFWMSDQDKPEIVNGNLPNELAEINKEQNPFVIEAQLFNEDTKVSYSLKYADGQYYIFRTKIEVDIKAAEKGDIPNVSFKKFHANRMGNRKLQFLQYWEECEDDLCAGMKVLQPKELVFVGFVNN